MTRRFDLRDHTADVAVEARADTPGGVFAAVADGMAAAMCDPGTVPGDGDRFDVSASAPNPERLLYDYLDTLIYERDVRGVLPVDNDATVSIQDEGDGDGEKEGTWTLTASTRGVPLDHVHARDLKAVTYSEMVVEEREYDTAPSGEPGQSDTDPSAEPGRTNPDPSAESGRTNPDPSAESGRTVWYAYVVFDV